MAIFADGWSGAREQISKPCLGLVDRQVLGRDGAMFSVTSLQRNLTTFYWTRESWKLRTALVQVSCMSQLDNTNRYGNPRWLYCKKPTFLILYTHCLWKEQLVQIGHFRITWGLFFEASLGAHPFICKSMFIHTQIKLICVWMKIDLHMKGEHQDSLRRRGLG